MIKYLCMLFTCVALFCASSSLANIESAADVMTFADDFSCEGAYPNQSYCDAVEFKAWAEGEKALVTHYLKNIKDPRIFGILEKIQIGKFTKIHRVSHQASWYNIPSERRVEFFRTHNKVLLWVDPATRVIGFMDSFFSGTEFMDPYALQPRKQLNVLHELIHVYDIVTDHKSSGDAYKAAAGWKWNGEKFVIQSVDYEKAMQEFQGILELAGKKESVKKAYALDRELGRSYGFPTLYGMTDFHESFAEAITYYIFDPSATSYYSKDLVNYLDKILMAQ